MSPLLGKLVPSEFRPNRDVSGEWAGRSDHELIVSLLHIACTYTDSLRIKGEQLLASISQESRGKDSRSQRSR